MRQVSFVIVATTSGALHTDWSEEVSEKESIKTRLADLTADSCPSDLRYASGPVKLRALSIRRLDKAAESKRKNIF